MNQWIEDLQNLREHHAELMLVTVAAVRGSAPREIGAKMIVTPQQSVGSIGGGQLEYQCSRIAVAQLRDPAAPARSLRRFPLGADLGQCCGGVVEVLFEKFPGTDTPWFEQLRRHFATREPLTMVTSIDAKYLITADSVYSTNQSCVDDEICSLARAMLRDPGCPAKSAAHAGETLLFEPIADSGMSLAIFGAGHVGSACVALLSKLDCNIRWIDNRRNVFPGTLPPRVTRIECADPVPEVGAMPDGAFYLVMTHSHPLDYDICHQVLRREDAAYCGLIGSLSKRRRFEKHMRSCGLDATVLDQLTCPIGVPGISGKNPEDIAVGVSAQLLQVRDARRVARGHAREHPSLKSVNKTVVTRSDKQLA